MEQEIPDSIVLTHVTQYNLDLSVLQPETMFSGDLCQNTLKSFFMIACKMPFNVFEKWN